MGVVNKRKNKGLFITFEGGEGVGKTTLIERIYASLTQKGFSVLKTCEPGGTTFGRHIRDILLHDKSAPFGRKSELFLFLADRSQHVEEKILPHLEKNDIILCDRFNDSTFAYQGAARSVDISLLKTLCQFAASGLQPDLTFFLDLDPFIGLKRSRKSKESGAYFDRIEKEDMSFHTKVREAFLTLAKEEPERFHVIDASLAFDQVFKKSMDEIHPKLQTIPCTN